MQRVHIIGGKNHGKTTLVCELIGEFQRRGLRVGTIKHTHHRHELDAPGKDSHRHRASGAAVVGVLSRSMNAVFWSNAHQGATDSPQQAEERYASFTPAFSECDLVLVEGDSQSKALKLEVWRAAFGAPPIANERTDVAAVISDETVEVSRPTLARANVLKIADFILKALADD